MWTMIKLLLSYMKQTWVHTIRDGDIKYHSIRQDRIQQDFACSLLSGYRATTLSWFGMGKRNPRSSRDVLFIIHVATNQCN